MPSPPIFVLNGLSLTKIQKLLPKKWSCSGNQLALPSTELCRYVLENSTASEESMIDSLLRSLKDLTKQGNLSDAFKTFSLVQQHAAASGFSSFLVHSVSSLLLSCTNLKMIPQGRQLHAHVISLGMDQHSILVPRLISFYSAFDLLAEACILTSHSNGSSPLPWNLLISLYTRNGLYGEVLSVYKEMLNKGIRADKFTYPLVLKACGENMEMDLGKQIHGSIEASSSGLDLFVQNAMISMYGRFGDITVSRRLFDLMPERDDVSWNSMISAYASKGMWNQAFEIFDCMLTEGIELNVIIWNTIAGGCLQMGNYNGALDLISQMKVSGGQVDHVAMITGFGACSHLGTIKLGKELHGSAIRNHYDELINVRNAMITMYARCKDTKNAYILFQLTELKNIITWNSMLSGYCHMDQSEEASFLFREMLLSGMQPNYITFASILPLCARIANLQHGRELHCYMIKSDWAKDYLLIWNALVDMYARSGKVLVAREVFELMTKRDEITYTSLIAGYEIQGDGLTALRLFDQMICCGIKPDHVTMIAVLSACSHSGLVVQGEKLFWKMYSAYGIIPRLEHYDCMVDLFGRAGLLQKAKETIHSMPYVPTAAMWATLLGACRIHRNTVIGEWAAGKLLEMRPENPGYYVLIANMYADARCWHKLAMVRRCMRDLGVKKAPGCSWVDVGAGFSPFVVEDTSNPHIVQIYSLLEELTDVMKERDHDALEELNPGMVMAC